ncbi:hypothetical protein RND81_12G075900 [Saponaria officinalis]|uniref:Uncharacterized protein n=1 Tax=Saponaria officinalis TaxID=3572 RepID=A0AAW1H7R7_SAPOF
MEESEKMMALKKAYAEIILNTAKEAAARVMVSERKAHEYCHDLSSTKDEALRLLLRLKQTMDSKIIEAEMKSQDQQRKIEVLEAQLQEAEDIVSNLREELSEAHVKLDKLSNNRLCSRSNTIGKDENGLSEAAVASRAATINNGVHGHSSANNSLEAFGCASELEIPSIISRRKEPELYLNKCNQRIHKCNGNLSKNVEALREDKEGQISFPRSMNTPIVEDDTFLKEEEHVDVKEVEDEEPVNIMQVLKSLIKRRKYKRNNASPSKRVSHAVKETCCDLSTSHACLRDSNDMHEGGDEDKVTESEDVNVNREVASSVVSTTKQSAFGDSLDALGSYTELETKNSHPLNLDVKLLETSDGLPSPPSKDRVLKYTFQRKRKRDSVVNDDN